jgi:hypothetical protein
MTNPTVLAADAAHHAPYKKISFATKQNNKTAADTASRTLSNIVLCEVGVAEGWGISIDAQFITDMVNDIKTNMPLGVKSNLRHNYENAGFQLGRITNIRIDGDRVLGDLKCYASADKSPLAPGMATWLTELVAEDPEAMMMSIVAEIAYSYQRDENGNEVPIWIEDEKGNWISPNYNMPIYVKYGCIESCDAVAEGALTDAMFSKNANNAELDFFTKLSNSIKRAFSRGKKGPDDEDTDFFPNMSAPMPPEGVLSAATQNPNSTMENPTTPTAPTMVEFAVAQTKIAELTTERDTLSASVAERNTKITALKAEKVVFATKLANAEAKITEMGKLAAAAHTGGKTDTTSEVVSFGSEHDKLKVYLGL